MYEDLDPVAASRIVEKCSVDEECSVDEKCLIVEECSIDEERLVNDVTNEANADVSFNLLERLHDDLTDGNEEEDCSEGWVAPSRKKISQANINAIKRMVSKMSGPEHPENSIVKKFEGGFITNSWDRLLKKTAVYFRWFAKVFATEIGEGYLTSYNMAIMFWLKQAMPATREAHSLKKLSKLTLWEKDGMLVVSGRAMEGLKHYFGVDHLPVLMAKTRVAHLIILSAHEVDHGGRDTTLVTATQTAWIVGGRKLAAKVTSLCIRCRYLKKQLVGQKMAELPPSMTVPSPPFNQVGLDLFGPLVVKKMGGAKTTRGKSGTFKVWGLLILCLNTKAVKLFIAAGYSTEDFLMAYEQFTSDHGHPAWIHSDRGSQLVKAAKEVDSPEYDWEVIENSTNANTRWVFCPSGSQWRNGAAEAFIKKVKRSLLINYGDKMLTAHELNTAFKRVAAILNSRPVAALASSKGGVDPDYITPLTPNMMLLGRANTDIPLKSYEDTVAPLARLEYVEEIEALWWNQFKCQDFAALVPTYKWQNEKRNMEVGDIVLIQYSSKAKSGEYRLGRVIVAELEKDNLVRTCIVRYSLLQHVALKDREKYTGITLKYVRVGVQRLVLIMPVEEQDGIRDVSKEEVAKAMQSMPSDKRDAMMGVSLGGVALLQFKKKSQPKISSHMIISMLKARSNFLATCSTVWMRKKAWWMSEFDLCGRELTSYYIKNIKNVKNVQN